MNKKQLEDELEKRLSDRGLLRYANDYFIGFKEIFEKHPKITDLYQVKFFLLCHSLELVLKAFLRHKGYSRKQLINLGHNLENLLRELYEKNNIFFDKNSSQIIIQVNQYYNSKQFEYFQSGSKVLVDIIKLADVTKLILDKINYKFKNET